MRAPDEFLSITERITDEIVIDWDGLLGSHPESEGVLRQLKVLEEMARFQRERRGAIEPAPGPALFHWGSLHVLEKLGEGGFADVFRAWDPSLHRDVALKLRHAGPEGSAQLWLAEARRLARVRHPNVLHVYGTAVHDGRPGLWMELVDGETLHAWVARQGALGAREAGRIGLDLASALGAVHAARVVHGDLKPSNVMRESSGRFVLTDFGAGSVLSPGARATTVTFATPVTAAPEVLLGGEAGFASDIYSLGVLLFWLVTGRYPVDGKDVAEIRRSHEKDIRASLRSLRPDLPAAFVLAVEEALEPDPAKRTPTADLFAESLSRAFALVGSASGQADVASIAVLPLANREPGSEDYVGDGLAGEILDDLVHIPGLRVVGRTSSFRYRDETADYRRIGNELGVSTVLSGSVSRGDGRLRVSLALVAAADGATLWSEVYDREPSDLHAVQEEIVAAVAEKLGVSWYRGTAPSGASPEAFDICLRGNVLYRQGNKENVERGLDCCRRAVALDPRYATAWARIAMAQVRLATFGLASTDRYDQARVAARRALEIDPEISLGHAVLGLIALFHDWDWATARQEIALARMGSPGDAGFTANAALVALAVGTADEAMELVRRATELEPLAARLWLNRANCAFDNGHMEEAGMAIRRGLDLDPNYPSGWSSFARIQLVQGRLDTALALIEKEKSEPWRLMVLSMIEHERGNPDASEAAVSELTRRFEREYACQIAEARAFRGDVSAAFEWLDRAYVQKDGGLLFIRRPPFTTGLAADPRWRAFLERLRLPV